MLENIKAVIFDLDGTLVDSMGIWRNVDIEFLERRGIPLPEDLPQELESMEFMEVARYFKERFSLPDTPSEIAAEWTDMAMDQYLYKISMKPGLKEFLEFLKKRKIPLGIASSNHMDLVRAALKGHGLEEYFSVIVTCSDVERAKPEPDVYLEAARRLGAAPSDCMVFEDIPVGIRAGKSAGMRTCAVQDSYSQCQDGEKRRLADYYIESYAQVLEGNYERLQECSLRQEDI